MFVEAGISAEDDVYHVGGQLKALGAMRILILVVLLAFLFLVLFEWMFVERLAGGNAVEDGVLCAQV